MQEGYAAKYNVNEGDGAQADDEGANEQPEDPMQGLEGLDVAGPKLR